MVLVNGWAWGSDLEWYWPIPGATEMAGDSTGQIPDMMYLYVDSVQGASSTPPVGLISGTIFSTPRGAHTSKMSALQISREGVSIEPSLGLCTLRPSFRRDKLAWQSFRGVYVGLARCTYNVYCCVVQMCLVCLTCVTCLVFTFYMVDMC